MSVTFAQGFSAAGVEAGISATPGKKDVALVVNEGPLTAAAGVFTTNRFCAAPVQWSRKAVADGSLKAVILNSGGATHAPAKRGMRNPWQPHMRWPGCSAPKTAKWPYAPPASSANCCRSTRCSTAPRALRRARADDGRR